MIFRREKPTELYEKKNKIQLETSVQDHKDVSLRTVNIIVTACT